MRFFLCILMIFFLWQINLGNCKALYPFFDETEKKYGYIDCEGKIIVSPKFSQAEAFSEGLGKIEVKVGNKTLIGFIDISGKIVIEPEFGDAGESSKFSDGTAAILTDKGWGYINRMGKVIIFVADATNNILPPLDIFSEGYGVVYTNKGVKFIDKQGKMVIPTYYDYSTPFYKGLALVTLGTKNAIINKKGEYVFPLQANDLSLSKDGIVGLRKSNYWSYFSNEKKILFKSKYELEFSEGFSAFNENNKWGIINKFGQVIVKPKFDFVYNFSEGVAVVGLNSKFGVIDTKGKIIVPLDYKYLEPQSKNGFIYFQKGDELGYINQKGKVIWKK
jgi:hypothetical protein